MSPSSYKISIVILNWNGKSDTAECLRSIQQMTIPAFSTIVVDNGSQDGSALYLKENFPSITLLASKENLGFAGGCNLGIKYALEGGCDAVLLLNNDTVVDKGLIEAFTHRISKEEKACILGAKILMYDDETFIDHLGGMWNQSQGAFDFIGHRIKERELDWKPEQDIDYACGAALFIPREVFKKIGYLEEKFFLIWEESDFCFRARREGFATKICLEALVWHKVSASFTSKAHSTYFFYRNRILWMERNLSEAERKELWKNKLRREMLHLLKLKTLKTIEAFLLYKVLKISVNTSKMEKLHKYFAAWRGLVDARNKRFGQGPSFIYEKNWKL